MENEGKHNDEIQKTQNFRDYWKETTTIWPIIHEFSGHIFKKIRENPKFYPLQAHKRNEMPKSHFISQFQLLIQLHYYIFPSLFSFNLKIIQDGASELLKYWKTHETSSRRRLSWSLKIIGLGLKIWFQMWFPFRRRRLAISHWARKLSYTQWVKIGWQISLWKMYCYLIWIFVEISMFFPKQKNK